VAGRKRLLFLGAALLVIIGVGSVAFGCGTAASAVVPLQYSYTPGDSWAYEMTMTTTGRVEGPGVSDTSDGSLPMDTTAKIRVSAAVKDVTDGIATVAFKYETLEATADGKPVDAGSQTPQEITAQIDRTGKVLSVQGLDQSGSASGLTDSGLPFDPTQLTDQFSVPFPEKGLGAVGDEWSATSTFPLPGVGQDITATTKAKMIALATENGRQIATIDYSVAVPMDLTLDLGAMLQKMAENAGRSDTAGIAFKMTMAGGMDYKGTAKVDTADGRAVSTDGVATIKIDMRITEAPDELVPRDQRGPFSMNMTLSIKMVEVE
jgi:hypothetical protein